MPALTANWNYAEGEAPLQFYVEDPFNTMPRGNAGTRDLWENLSKLATIIPNMASLTSFSFHVTEQASEMRSGPEGFWLRRIDLHAILRALSGTVVDLEIDTKGFDQLYSPEQHLCPQIAKLISQCKNIRIRLSRTCTEIVPPGITNGQLESMVISLLQPAHHSSTKNCSLEEDGIRRLDTTQTVKEHCVRLRHGLVPELLRVKQACPKIKCLRLMDSVGRSVLPKPYFVAINTRDFVLGMTTSQPLYLLHSIWPTDIYGWRSLKDGEYKDSCGKFEELEEIIEGSPWVETGNGSRLALKNASSHTQKLYKLKVSTLEDKVVYQGRAHKSCELEVEGFLDVELLERELLPEEDGTDYSDSDEDDYD